MKLSDRLEKWDMTTYKLTTSFVAMKFQLMAKRYKKAIDGAFDHPGSVKNS